MDPGFRRDDERGGLPDRFSQNDKIERWQRLVKCVSASALTKETPAQRFTKR
jgi:hypothetical protein